MLTSLNLAKTIPVGNADAGSYFNNEILQAVDYGVCPSVESEHVASFAFH